MFAVQRVRKVYINKVIKSKCLNIYSLGVDTHLKLSFEKLGNTFILQKDYLNTETNDDDFCSDSWKLEGKETRMVGLC